ncbi:uncharacterized protein FIBRA_09462 [Fibroporia radiculosa]|uniref:Uncharacterized protein n=1 Tax=Fibroporia radiculosa TaxID=599839 RepID=J7RHQ9_9APHY|nr:uncharacterized protein FIBRA_09462 [Fibroporia radiculosa]CCM07127.1 predicted protein [Fibroporia radiculosa]
MKPVRNWNLSDKEWEEHTWEYLLTRDDNLLESLWASLQDIKDPGITNEGRNSYGHRQKWTNVELSLELPTWRNISNNTSSPLSPLLLAPCLATSVSAPNVKLMDICRVSVGIGYAPIADFSTPVINSTPPLTSNPDNFPVPLTNPGTYKSVVLNGNCE